MTTPTGLLSGVSVSHHRTGIADIEAVSHDTQVDAVRALLDREGVEEAFVIQTCNRAEAFVVTEEAEAGRRALRPYVAGVDTAGVEELDHEESLRHLMRVAAGLESLVLGEDQILGQVRDAYEDAREAGGVGPVLDDALVKAIRVGERARTETSINEGVTSLGSAAVRLARREVDLDDATALVVGAGEMGTLAARALDGEVERLVLANRSTANAEHLAGALACEAVVVGLDAVPVALDDADLVVAATASDGHVLDAGTLGAAGETLVVDLAQPRDVHPDAADLPDVTLRDLDALEAVTAETRDQRRAAAAEVEAIIDEEFDHLVTQYKRKRADEVVAAMYEGAERVKARELDTALSRLDASGDLTDEQREVVESLADSLVGQLLAPPTRSLRDAAENDDWSTINTALHLFGPGLEPGVDAPIDRWAAAEPDASTDADAERDTDDDEGVRPPEAPDGVPADVSPDELPDEMRRRMPDAVLERLSDD